MIFPSCPTYVNAWHRFSCSKTQRAQTQRNARARITQCSQNNAHACVLKRGTSSSGAMARMRRKRRERRRSAKPMECITLSLQGGRQEVFLWTLQRREGRLIGKYVSNIAILLNKTELLFFFSSFRFLTASYNSGVGAKPRK